MTDGRPITQEDWRAHLVRNTAFAALECSKRAALRKDQEEHGLTALYVYDTNIIVGHCAPWRFGGSPGVDKAEGYGQVLPLRPAYHLPTQKRLRIAEDEARQAEAVALLLIKQALSSRVLEGKKYPIYQLPSHFAETLGVYDAVRKRADAFAKIDANAIVRRSKSTVDSLLVVLRAILKEAPLEPSPDGRISRYASHILQRFVQRTRSQQPLVREWDRFYALNIHEGGLFSTEEFHWPVPGTSQRGSRTPATVSDRILSDYSEQETKLKRQLSDHALFEIQRQIKSRSDNRMQRDADAIADLFLLNKRLKDRGVPCRLVLLTGDRNLTQLFFRGLQGSKSIDAELAARFGRDCIQHLWSFVDEIAAQTGTTETTGTAEKGKADRTVVSDQSRPEFFSGLLVFRKEPIPKLSSVDWSAEALRQRQDTYFEMSRHPSPDQLKALDDRDIEGAYDRWEDFTRRAVEAATLDTYNQPSFVNMKRLQDQIVEVVQKSANEKSIDWQRLQSEVEEVVIRARDRSNVVFSDLGADVLMAARESGTRNPPDLMFDSLKNTNAIFDNLADPRVIYTTVARFSEDFERIKLDCHDSRGDGDDRQEVHLKYLVLGALVASADRWSVAEEHAKNAVEIIERSRRLRRPIPVRDTTDPSQRSHMSGREAYFLRAIARRVRSAGKHDLDVARSFLDLASERLEEDRSCGTASGIPYIRFHNEALALALSAYYFARQRQQDSHCDEQFATARMKLDELLKERARLIDNESDPSLLRGEKYDAVKPATRVGMATNLIQIAVIATFRKHEGWSRDESPVSDEMLSAALEDIYEHSDIMEKLQGVLHDLRSETRFQYVHQQGRHPSSICSAVIMRYAAVGNLLLRDPRYWYPRTRAEVNYLFERKAEATSYDSWRYPQLKAFALKIL